MVIWLFGQMQSAKTLADLEATHTDMCRLLLSKNMPSMQASAGSVTEKEAPEELKDESETSKWRSCRHTSPGRHKRDGFQDLAFV